MLEVWICRSDSGMTGVKGGGRLNLDINLSMAPQMPSGPKEECRGYVVLIYVDRSKVFQMVD